MLFIDEFGYCSGDPSVVLQGDVLGYKVMLLRFRYLPRYLGSSNHNNDSLGVPCHLRSIRLVLRSRIGRAFCGPALRFSRSFLGDSLHCPCL